MHRSRWILSLSFALTFSLAFSLSLAYAEDNVDDVYYWPGAASNPQPVTSTSTSTPTKSNQSQPNTQSKSTSGAEPKVEFIQVQDTVVKAIIRR